MTLATKHSTCTSATVSANVAVLDDDSIQSEREELDESSLGDNSSSPDRLENEITPLHARFDEDSDSGDRLL